MTEIKRNGTGLSGQVIETKHGSFVDYDDHAAIVAALQEQVRALVAESARCKFEISRCHQTVDEMFKNREKWIDKEWLSSIWSTSKKLMDETPATDAVIREIRAQTANDLATEFGLIAQSLKPNSVAYRAAKSAVFKCVGAAARIRSGEQP